MDAVLKSLADISGTIQNLTSYADALTAAIKRLGNIEIGSIFHEEFGPKLVFKRVPDTYQVDHTVTGRHTMEYQLEGTGKRYRVMIEPVMETHGAKS